MGEEVHASWHVVLSSSLLSLSLSFFLFSSSFSLFFFFLSLSAMLDLNRTGLTSAKTTSCGTR